ncbi:acyloxyacyl hydrolase [Flavobacterium sp. M31R6]|uniref:acyloxyacyl hydrolase n=1 Tax=Flavobacterium sp. M31R6 TaxID=2739062 RepID=UPI001569F0C5|nr:acyloxyacyl hydrolase [Flavobacterium sp. M31R6]QKJ64142.1 acyloxyacyl hydrolase [Flavobacterium sp. M31R6]
MNKNLFIVLFLLSTFAYSKTNNYRNTMLVGTDSLEIDTIKNTKARFKYFEIKTHAGVHLYSGKSLNAALEQGYGSLEARVGWYPKSPENWSQYYGNPSYGVGFYSGLIGDPEILGKPNALYGFINFPLSKPGKRTGIEISPSFGLTYNLVPFNEIENPNNDAIGSKIAVYFNLHFGAAYQMTREMDLIYGLDISHFSNGRSNVPNHGLNMFGLNLGLRYNYNKEYQWSSINAFEADPLPARIKVASKSPNMALKTNAINLYTAFGIVQKDEDKGTSKHYSTFSVVGEYQYKFSNMHGFTAGLDYFRDESLSPKYPSSERNLLGVHAGYDFMFWKMAIRMQAGTYLSDDRGKGAFFLRPALQYEISKKIYVQVGLKTLAGAAADWIEFGVGFKPFNW